MARHTKLKIAAVVTTFVATLGIVAAGPATGSDAGKTVHTTSVGRVGGPCC